MPTAQFTITGEFLTNHARDRMLEDEPGRAYRLIADCLSGEDTDTVARRLLKGEVKLVGDSTEGIYAEDDDDASEYIKQLRWVYAGRVRLDKQWYRPRGVVLSWGPDDARAAGKAYGPVPTTASSSGMKRWAQLRADYYACDGEKALLVNGARWTVFEPCGEPPQWLTPAHTPEQAVREFEAAGRQLEELGAFPERSPRRVAYDIIEKAVLEGKAAEEVNDLADQIVDAQRAAALEQLGEQVRKQAGSDVFDMTLLDGRVVQVPRAPFVRWALRKPLDIDPSRLPPWQTVSESGLKMCMDNPYHTDWLLGAGLTLEDAYDDNVNTPAWDHALALQVAEVDRV